MTHRVVIALGRDPTVGNVVSLWAMVKRSQVLCIMQLLAWLLFSDSLQRASILMLIGS